MHWTLTLRVPPPAAGIKLFKANNCFDFINQKDTVNRDSLSSALLRRQEPVFCRERDDVNGPATLKDEGVDGLVTMAMVTVIMIVGLVLMVSTFRMGRESE